MLTFFPLSGSWDLCHGLLHDHHAGLRPCIMASATLPASCRGQNVQAADIDGLRGPWSPSAVADSGRCGAQSRLSGCSSIRRLAVHDPSRHRQSHAPSKSWVFPDTRAEQAAYAWTFPLPTYAVHCLCRGVAHIPPLCRVPQKRRRGHHIADRDPPKVLDDTVHTEIRRPGAGPVSPDELQRVDRALSGGGVEGDDGTARIAGHHVEPYLGAKLDDAAEPLVLLVWRAATQQKVGPEASAVERHPLSSLVAQVSQRGLRHQGPRVLVVALPRLVRPHQRDRLATDV